MSRLEFIYYLSTSILIISGFVWFVINLFCVWRYERKINGLHNELNNRIREEKDRLTSMSIIEARIKKLHEEYGPEIEELERRRRFILEKLPFVK